MKNFASFKNTNSENTSQPSISPSIQAPQIFQTSLLIKNNPNLDNDDEPLIGYVNQLLIEAVNQNISDLHFEPHESFYRIRAQRWHFV